MNIRNSVFLSSIALTAVGLGACDGAEQDSLSETALPDLIFVRYTQEGSDLYGLALSTSVETQLTDSPAMEEFPAWSRDGTRFSYLLMNDDDVSINIRDFLSGEDKVLLSGMAEPVSWSGNSEFVVITREDGDTRGLVGISVENGEEFVIQTGASGDAYATWSPTSDTVAFESTRDGNPEIYSANIDGSEISRLTDNTVLDEWPQWSNDGQFIAYASGVEGDKDLWVMRSDGSNKKQLTNDLLFGDSYPSWSPDDSQLVFTVQENESGSALFLVDVESATLSRLTDGGAASWRPHVDGGAAK
jgi:Tol biopolymer transport system component